MLRLLCSEVYKLRWWGRAQDASHGTLDPRDLTTMPQTCVRSSKRHHSVACAEHHLV